MPRKDMIVGIRTVLPSTATRSRSVAGQWRSVSQRAPASQYSGRIHLSELDGASASGGRGFSGGCQCIVRGGYRREPDAPALSAAPLPRDFLRLSLRPPSAHKAL